MNPIQITSAVGVEDFPTWSPNGRILAFEASGDIWVTPVSGGPARQLTDGKATGTYAELGQLIGTEYMSPEGAA